MLEWGLHPIGDDEAALYTVIDASNVVGLEELLAQSGLDHRCLFVGAAFEEFRDKAPWLVRLEDHNRFTAQLFSEGDAPWLLWHHEAHVFLRSASDLDDVWSHLRRILRFQDHKGRWQMFRFWQQDFMRFCAEAMEHDLDALNRFFGGGLVRVIFGVTPAGMGWHLANPAPTGTPALKAAELGDVILPLARRYSWHDFQIRLFTNLSTRYEGKAPEMKRADVISASNAIRGQGYRKENAVADMTEAALVARHYKLPFDRLAHDADPDLQFAEATRAKRIKIAVNEAAAEFRYGQ
ncbi:DUF4123 domain-containing protein [Litoreibacter janthinus]|uniref:DUF4123 domain-containing protein n=1 Tax=Litoreibacter janthinus TaxID=670154 RepID=A0A1I6G903_9RHOB|nr:DUF4123 domain-containing protein [Litoreibacter janthinus]SFR38630.1 protein of unknown function [Litoreibacter janthinus]